MAELALHVASLAKQPLPGSLPIIMDDPGGKHRYRTDHVPGLGVPLVRYRKMPPAQENCIRGIERSKQLARENGIVERDAIGANRRVRIERCNLRYERITHLIVCIKAEDPICGDLRVLDCIPPLVSMTVETALEDAYIGKIFQYRQRPVRTTTVDNDNVFGPAKVGQS